MSLIEAITEPADGLALQGISACAATVMNNHT